MNYIYYNRLTDEPGGHASYELEFPNGGTAYVVGNIIEQGVRTENPNIISFGIDGYKWPKNELYLVNNTLVDNRPKGGVFLRVKPGDVTVEAANNLLVGHGRLEYAGLGDYRNNLTIDRSEFAHTANAGYHLKGRSRLVGQVVNPSTANEINLQPQSKYVHPARTKALKGGPRNPGALQSMGP